MFVITIDLSGCLALVISVIQIDRAISATVICTLVLEKKQSFLHVGLSCREVDSIYIYMYSAVIVLYTR